LSGRPKTPYLRPSIERQRVAKRNSCPGHGSTCESAPAAKWYPRRFSAESAGWIWLNDRQAERMQSTLELYRHLVPERPPNVAGLEACAARISRRIWIPSACTCRMLHPRGREGNGAPGWKPARLRSIDPMSNRAEDAAGGGAHRPTAPARTAAGQRPLSVASTMSPEGRCLASQCRRRGGRGRKEDCMATKGTARVASNRLRSLRRGVAPAAGHVESSQSRGLQWRQCGQWCGARQEARCHEAAQQMHRHDRPNRPQGA
jgi:hypothetical protein